ncbi:MAG: YhbY family RNA-binding protein [Nanoarchaeota archaeon]|nr:YhbY family RNA-binding protein [Nanoarchaeota archaeon]
MDKKELKKMANGIKPEFSLGKQGISDNFIDSVNKYLKVHNLVKIKCLIATDKENLQYFADEVSKQTQAELIEMKGFTFTIYKEES